MQFYLNGYRPGDPEVRPAAEGRPRSAPVPAEVDVLMIGTGPAGLVLAAQLAEFPEISTLVAERREGPLQLGQADGVACRTVEMFQAFGLADQLVREAHWINETVFWKPGDQDSGSIVRSSRVQDVADGLSEFPHVIVNQARMQDYLLEHMRRSPSRLEPDYGMELVDLTVDTSGEHAVRATLRRQPSEPASDAEHPAEELVTVRARYAVGCDGARSAVRRAVGIELQGDARNHAWGVMDMLAETDFPDVRFKAAIQSDHGSLLIIPREGGYLVRFYVDLGELDPADAQARRRFALDDIVATAQSILHPYSLDVRDVAWWSVYEVGQRIAERFDDVAPEDRGTRAPRVFIAGDACHTHSAKAGQGMNVSMQDGFNLGWKLASVLQVRSPDSLLETYSAERRAVAQELIDFDLTWSSAMSAKPKGPQNPDGMDPAQMRQIFTEGGRFTAGFGTCYQPSMITGSARHQGLATGFPVGERFHSAPVVRLADARPLGLGHVAQADGRWRLYAFADKLAPHHPDSRLRGLCEFLTSSERSPLLRHTRKDADPDTVFDLRAVIQQNHREVSITEVPEALFPAKGRFGLRDYEKVFTSDQKEGTDIFQIRGVDRTQGCLVIVRPDQYIAEVLPLDAHEELAEFFDTAMLPAVDHVTAGSMA